METILRGGSQAVVSRDHLIAIFDQDHRSRSSVAIVGVDVEAEDGVNFDWVLAAGGGAELPVGKCGEELGGHGGGAGFEDLNFFEIAGGGELAFDDHAGAGQCGGKIGAEALRPGERAGVGVGCDFGELHDDGSVRSVDVDGVVVAGKFAVEIECAAGAGSGDDGDGRTLVAFEGRAEGNSGGVVMAGVEAGEGDDGAAAADIDAGSGRVARGGAAGAAGAGGGRDSAAGAGVGAAGGTGLACAGFLAGETAAGTGSGTDAGASAGAAQSGSSSAGGRQGERTFAAGAGLASGGAGVWRYDYSGVIARGGGSFWRGQSGADLTGAGAAITLSARAGKARAWADGGWRGNDIGCEMGSIIGPARAATAGAWSRAGKGWGGRDDVRRSGIQFGRR